MHTGLQWSLDARKKVEIEENGYVQYWQSSGAITHMILRCRQIPKFSCRTTAETAAVAIFPPPQAFLAHFARFVPILCAVKQI